jgi:hypothetical protein
MNEYPPSMSRGLHLAPSISLSQVGYEATTWCTSGRNGQCVHHRYSNSWNLRSDTRCNPARLRANKVPSEVLFR